MPTLRLLILAVVSSIVLLSQVAHAKRPSFLFIIADDQSPFDLKTYNPFSELKTPAINRLAAEGMVIDGAYHMGSYSGAVCTPSRHMIMTGRTVWHLPLQKDRGYRNGAAEFDPADFSMAAIFNRAGYDTMRTCKIGNSYKAANARFSVVKDATRRGGTAETGSAWHADQVLKYLQQRQTEKDADPFLIYFGFSHPHDTRDGTPELLAKYGATNHTDEDSLPPIHWKQPGLPVNYLPKHPFHHGHPDLRDEVAVSGVWKNRDERTIRNEIGRQFACSENIDRQVDRVINQLRDMGELDNTYIIYTSDHGMAIGRHGLQGKQNLYEHTWRVPFIVRGPGIVPGRAQGNIYLLDVLSTLCDYADVEIPETVEGTSFRPVLEGRKTTIRDTLFGVYCGGTKPGMRSVRRGDWKLIKYDVLDGDVRETQLFNLEQNPHELLSEHHDRTNIGLIGEGPKGTYQKNLADDPDYAEQRAEMEELLLSEMRRLDDPYRLWDQPDDDLPPPE